MAYGDARVTFHEGEGKWAVDVEGAAWAASRHDKKERAEQAGRTVPEACGLDLIVQGIDGRTEKAEAGSGNEGGGMYIGIGTVALILIIVLLIWLL